MKICTFKSYFPWEVGMVVFLIFHVGLYLGSSGELEATLLTRIKFFFSFQLQLAVETLVPYFSQVELYILYFSMFSLTMLCLGSSTTPCWVCSLLLI